jgi:peptidoglycan/xylan/chitin deacetylase (PgdA/CDA1 family)
VQHPVSTGSRLRPSVALTFDDGPDGEQTRNVLDVLASVGARATFFLTGCSVARNPTLAQETVAEGHEVANHGDFHYRMNAVPPLFVWANLACGNGIIEAATGVRPRFFRPPHGASSDVVLSCAAACNLQTVLWSVMADDWHGRAAVDSIAANISAAGAGDIVLCHDKGPHIASALRRCIPMLQAKGLALVTLTSLLQAA